MLSSGASHCCRCTIFLVNQWPILIPRAGVNGTVQCRIVYPFATPDLRITIGHWHAVPVRKHHVVKTCWKHGGEAPHILDLGLARRCVSCVVSPLHAVGARCVGSRDSPCLESNLGGQCFVARKHCYYDCMCTSEWSRTARL
jgi:hypothetical protein